MSTHTLDALFPLPSQPPSSLSPTAMPGISEGSAAMLVQCLKEDYTKYHIFFNHMGFHNHLTHHLFAAYKMGAKPSLIRAAFDEHADYQRPAFKSPVSRILRRFYYNSYLDFFSNEVLTKGVAPTLETYVFASDANWGSETDPNKAPQMLDRFMGGLVHPIIHFGHGAEFNIPGMAAEGLAWTAVHGTATKALMPPEFFRSSTPAASGTHSFTILARMLKDPKLAPGVVVQSKSGSKFADTLKKEGALIRAYADEWVGDVSSAEELKVKIEELSWLAVLIYGVGGWSKAHGFRADFFTMHLVTSSLFMPSVLALLSPQSQSALMRCYVA
ncbi:hypothetical protein EXIGLDRAFT_628822, partial [Exidia glandulosa HHB12029]